MMGDKVKLYYITREDFKILKKEQDKVIRGISYFFGYSAYLFDNEITAIHTVIGDRLTSVLYTYLYGLFDSIVLPETFSFKETDFNIREKVIGECLGVIDHIENEMLENMEFVENDDSFRRSFWTIMDDIRRKVMTAEVERITKDDTDLEVLSDPEIFTLFKKEKPKRPKEIVLLKTKQIGQESKVAKGEIRKWKVVGSLLGYLNMKGVFDKGGANNIGKQREIISLLTGHSKNTLKDIYKKPKNIDFPKSEFEELHDILQPNLLSTKAEAKLVDQDVELTPLEKLTLLKFLINKKILLTPDDLSLTINRYGQLVDLSTVSSPLDTYKECNIEDPAFISRLKLLFVSLSLKVSPEET